MGLRKPVLSNEALLAAGKVLDSTYKATVSIFNPMNSSKSYNFANGTRTGSDKLIKKDVRARVQPINAAIRRDIPINETEQKRFRITFMGAENLGLVLHKGYKIVVTSTDIASDLTQMEFYISDFPNSTNPLERAVIAVADLEIRHV